MAKKPIQKKSRKAKKAGGRRRKGVRTFRPYIARCLKAQGKLRISKKAMSICNSFAADLFDRIASEAGNLARHCKTKTLSSRSMLSACRLTLPGEFAKHAMVSGSNAVRRAQ